VYVFVVAARRTRIDVRHAVERTFGVRVTNVQHLEPQGEAPSKPQDEQVGKRPGHQAGCRNLGEAATASTSSRRTERTPPMPLRKRKPTSAGRRSNRLGLLRDQPVHGPERSLSYPSPHRRAQQLRAQTARHRGGGHKHSTGSSISKGTRTGVPPNGGYRVRPNRNARSPCSTTTTGEKRYILAPANVGVGDVLQSGQGSDIRPGNALPLRYIPVGSTIHNIEFASRPGREDGARCRYERPARRQRGPFSPPCVFLHRDCAGCRSDCRGTLGEVGNSEAELISIGKAGRNRWKGKRPQTRGVAMTRRTTRSGCEGKSSGWSLTRCRHGGKPRGRTRTRHKRQTR